MYMCTVFAPMFCSVLLCMNMCIVLGAAVTTEHVHIPSPDSPGMGTDRDGHIQQKQLERARNAWPNGALHGKKRRNAWSSTV